MASPNAEEFQKRAYGCLEEFSSNSLSRPLSNDMIDRTTSDSVVVMTYAPLEGDDAIRDLRSPAGGGWSVRHMVIHELSQVHHEGIYLLGEFSVYV